MRFVTSSLLLSSLTILGLTIAGCGSSGPFARGGDPDRNTRLAAAVQSEYPTTQPSENINVVAIVERDQITLANRTNEPIRDAKVWVNRTFVHEADLLPPGANVTIPFEDFFTRAGTTMAGYQTQITTVQLETQDGFYNLDTPVQN